MGNFHKIIKLIMEFLKAPFLVLNFSYYTLMTFLMMLSVILPSILMILLSTLMCDETSDLWQQLETVAELESDPRDTVDWGKKWFADFNAEKKKSLLCLTDMILVLLTWKWIGLFLMKNHILRCWGCLSLLKLDWESYIVSIARIASKKIGALICSMKFFSLRLLCISINLPYNLAWNTVAMPGLVLLAAAWIC